MNDDLLKYIRNEKDISEYKISLLEKGEMKQYKCRLLAAENEFIEYPFEKMVVENLAEMKEAMLLFKTDRNEFFKKYENKNALKKRVITNGQINILRKKIEFYESLYKSILDIKIKEINLIQDSYIKGQSNFNVEALESMGIDSLIEAEGAALSKKRARIQILMYCLGRFIYERIKIIKPTVSADLSPDEYDLARKSLDDLLEKAEICIFKHYNNGIVETPLLINGTLGHNNFVHSVYPLVNLLDKYDEDLFVERLLAEDKSFFNNAGRPIRKRFVERGLGVSTPLSRVGNESIKLLYLDLWSKSGVCLSKIMTSIFFNHNRGGRYYKAVPTQPIWSLNDYINNPFLLREVLALVGLEEAPLVSDINFKDKNVISMINKSKAGRIEVDGSVSKMLIAATRSEAEHIKVAYSRIDLLINQIRNDYKGIFGYSVYGEGSVENRISMVKSIRGKRDS
jgi:hypothetical protein